jgi:hypothetical protein
MKMSLIRKRWPDAWDEASLGVAAGLKVFFNSQNMFYLKAFG